MATSAAPFGLWAMPLVEFSRGHTALILWQEVQREGGWEGGPQPNVEETRVSTPQNSGSDLQDALIAFSNEVFEAMQQLLNAQQRLTQAILDQASRQGPREAEQEVDEEGQDDGEAGTEDADEDSDDADNDEDSDDADNDEDADDENADDEDADDEDVAEDADADDAPAAADEEAEVLTADPNERRSGRGRRR